VTYAQYDTSEVNKVQKAVEFASEKVAHTSSDAWDNVNNAVNKTAEATVNSGKQVGNIISTWIL
jgi:hypothetical protein